MRSQAFRLRYALVVLGTALAGLAGYGGYELYPRFGLPPLEGLTLLLLAAAAGVASFFAPCSFPLLVTLLARGSQPAGGVTGPGRGLGPVGFGAALALGAGVFLLAIGAGIAAGGGALFAQVTFTSTTGQALRLAVGALLIGLGLVQVGLVSDRPFRRVEAVTKNLNRAQARLRRRRPLLGFTAFGFFYLLAGFG